MSPSSSDPHWGEMVEISADLAQLGAAASLERLVAIHSFGMATVPLVFALNDSIAVRSRHLIEFLDSSSGKTNIRTFTDGAWDCPTRARRVLVDQYAKWISEHKAHLVTPRTRQAAPHTGEMVTAILDAFELFVAAHLEATNNEWAASFRRAVKTARLYLTSPDRFWADFDFGLDWDVD